MQLVINSFGAYLHKSGNCFVIKVDDKSTEISVIPPIEFYLSRQLESNIQ